MALNKRTLITLGSDEIEAALREYIFKKFPEFGKDCKNEIDLTMFPYVQITLWNTADSSLHGVNG